MGFGISFGKNKTKVNQTGTVNKTETTSQAGTEATNSTQTGTQTQQASQTGSSTGSSSTNQTSLQTGQTSGTTTTTGKQASFSDGLTSEIESAISGLLQGVNETGQVVGRGVEALGEFDAGSFVRNIMANATARSESSLDESVNGIMDRIGSSVNNNSMAALLQQRAVNDSNANLAGVQGQATAQANQILAQNLAASSGAMNETNNIGVALTNALKGGNVTSTQSTAMEELQQMLNQATGNTQTAEQNQQDSTSTQQTTQVLAQIINNLLNGTTSTVGTETLQGTTSKKGGGLSLGF
jgi:hypothetical protein